MILKNFFYFFLSLTTLKDKVSILMYHSVGDNELFFTVSAKDFEKQISYIAQKGFRCVFMSELMTTLKQNVTRSNTIALTFDDGYKDNYVTVFPILKKYNIKATIFIPNNGTSWTSVLDTLSIHDMNDMVRSGLVEFMPHTRDHADLRNLSKDEILYQIRESKKFIEDSINQKITHPILAYPRGKYNNEVISALKSEGWSGAVTTKAGLIDKNSQLFELPRNTVDSATSFCNFKLKLSSGITLFLRIKSIIKKCKSII